ncbi:hypothetical protein ACFLT8_07115, partial [Chloroflexota bacterium]
SFGKKFIFIPFSVVGVACFTLTQVVLSLWVLIASFLVWEELIGSFFTIVGFFFFGLAPVGIIGAPFILWWKVGFAAFIGLTPEKIAVVEGKANTKQTVKTEGKPNRKEAAQVEIILTKEKETPGTWRFKEDIEAHPLTIYLTKEKVKELGNPESIKVTIEAA